MPSIPYLHVTSSQFATVARLIFSQAYLWSGRLPGAAWSHDNINENSHHRTYILNVHPISISWFTGNCFQALDSIKLMSEGIPDSRIWYLTLLTQTTCLLYSSNLLIIQCVSEIFANITVNSCSVKRSDKIMYRTILSKCSCVSVHISKSIDSMGMWFSLYESPVCGVFYHMIF